VRSLKRRDEIPATTCDSGRRTQKCFLLPLCHEHHVVVSQDISDFLSSVRKLRPPAADQWWRARRCSVFVVERIFCKLRLWSLCRRVELKFSEDGVDFSNS
jgi:hypothetical protein